MGRLLVLLLIFALGAAQAARVVITTGTTGGVYFFYGQALANVLNRAGVADTSTLQTGGSLENISILRNRANAGSTYYCALASLDSAWLAYSGQDAAFSERKADMGRILFYLFPSFIQVVTKESSGIKSVADLKGKRVSTGLPGSSNEAFALQVLKGAGIDTSALGRLERLPATESARALAQGSIDAYIWIGAAPAASILELSKTLSRRGDRVALVAQSKDDPLAQFLQKQFPGMVAPRTLPKGVYATRDDVSILSVGNVLLCPASMPDALAYAVTKAVFNNLGGLKAVTALAGYTNLQNATTLYDAKPGIPFHPGAIKYLKEKGAIK